MNLPQNVKLVAPEKVPAVVRQLYTGTQVRVEQVSGAVGQGAGQVGTTQVQPKMGSQGNVITS